MSRKGVGRRRIWGRDGGPGPWSGRGPGRISRQGCQGGAGRAGQAGRGRRPRRGRGPGRGRQSRRPLDGAGSGAGSEVSPEVVTDKMSLYSFKLKWLLSYNTLTQALVKVGICSCCSPCCFCSLFSFIFCCETAARVNWLVQNQVNVHV